MSRKKRKEYDEYRRYCRLKEENQKLKKEVVKLRKMIREMSNDALENKANRVENNETIYRNKCEVCGNDDTDTIDINRRDGNFELYVCNSCGNRGSLKRNKKE